MTISRKIKILPLVIVAGIVISVFSFLKFSDALSSYDDNYVLTDNMTLTDSGAICPEYDLGKNWYSYALSATLADTHFWSAPQLSAMKTDLKNAVDLNYSWGVTTQEQAGNSKVVHVYWSKNTASRISFTTNEVVIDNGGGSNPSLGKFTYMIKRAHDGSGGCNPELIDYATPNSFQISNNQTSSSVKLKNVFVGGVVNITYPALYGGLPIRQTYTPPDTVYPNFTYKIDGFNIEANYLYNVPLNEPKTAQLRWRFVGKDTSGFYTVVLKDVTQLLHEQFDYTSGFLGDFELWLDLIPTSPTIITPPDTTDTLVQRIKIDGNLFAGDTSSNECTNGVCNVPDLYENCGLTDVACTLRNFGVYLKGLLISLFVPSSAYISTYFTGLSEFFTEKLGILLYPITFITDTLNLFIDSASSPACSFSTGGTIFGASPTLNFCVVEDTMPTLYNPIMAFVRGSILFGMIWAIRRKLMSILRGDKEA